MAAQAAAPRDHLRVAVESFRPYWEDIRRLMIRRNGGHVDAASFCEMAKIGAHEYELIMKAMRDVNVLTLSFDLVDRVMVAVGMQYLVPSLYVVSECADHERPLQDGADDLYRTEPRGVGRLAQAHARRVQLQEMWCQGWSMQRIAAELETSENSIGATMSKMRDAGWELPYRQRPTKDRPLVSRA